MKIPVIILYELKLMLRNKVELILLLTLPVAMIALMGYAMKPFLDLQPESLQTAQASYTQDIGEETAGSLEASVRTAAERQGVPEDEMGTVLAALKPAPTQIRVNPIPVAEPSRLAISSFQFFGAGMLIFFLMTCGLGLGSNIINERTDRVFYRIVSFPVTHNQYLAGKAAGNALIGFFQAAAIIIFTSLAFRLDWGPNYFGILLVVAAVMLITSGIAVTVSSLLNSSKSLTMLLTMLYWMLAFISGSFAPLPIFEPIAGYTPNHWAFQALTGLMTDAGLPELVNCLLYLLLFGLVFWTTGVMLYKRRVANE